MRLGTFKNYEMDYKSRLHLNEIHLSKQKKIIPHLLCKRLDFKFEHSELNNNVECSCVFPFPSPHFYCCTVCDL